MKSKFFSLLAALSVMVILAPKSNAQVDSCCSVPDSLRVISLTDSSFCVSWHIRPHPPCDTATKSVLQWKKADDTVWQTVIIHLHSFDTTIIFCDSAMPDTKYKWQVKSVCKINDSTSISSDYIKGPNFTTLPLGPGNNITLNKSLTDSKPLRIYPNPARDMVTIEGYKKSAGIIKILINNSEGKIVSDKTFTSVAGNYKIPLSLSGLGKGIYFVVVSDEGKATILKIIKE